MTSYQNQLAEKKQYLQQLLQAFKLPEIQVFSSPEQHYRMRAEFRIWHDGDTLSYAMFQSGQKANRHSLLRINQFPAASEAINQLMPQLLEAVSASPILKNRWYQCEFLSTLSGQMLVTMIYHKKLDAEWETAARQLEKQFNIWIIGRSRGQKVVLTQDFVTETLTVHQKTFHYRQIEGGFTQPNARICEQMLEWACQQAQTLGGDLLELYCGNGNFTLPLSQYFNRVLATEVSKTSVQAAHWNIEANHIKNIQIARLSAEEFSEAHQGLRHFRRLEEQNIDLKQYQFSTIFIDPPRAGVDEQTLQQVAQFNHIIYVSCNPETLRNNLETLCHTHDICSAALFDQFPFTHHIESAVLLKRKTA